jgi:hypothetical protein
MGLKKTKKKKINAGEGNVIMKKGMMIQRKI